ncbi:putative serine/threonine-protein kinase fhkE [Oratosquilla oratoria]|uniref:putative serine/threonine-protein kinase fhkE n=1 Tax=Oratosquilla oratoria TaxID=337810 RepID=UPI003F7620F7
MITEARVLNALSDVPQLIGVGEKPVTLITGFCGTTLGDEMRRTSFSDAQSIDIELQFAETLQKMHERGWAHDDLKLDNVVVKPKGNQYDVIVTDFGNATTSPLLTSGTRHTSEGPATARSSGVTLSSFILPLSSFSGGK